MEAGVSNQRLEHRRSDFASLALGMQQHRSKMSAALAAASLVAIPVPRFLLAGIAVKPQGGNDANLLPASYRLTLCTILGYVLDERCFANASRSVRFCIITKKRILND